MREILFRGKRLDNGEWVTGDLRHGGYYLNDPDVYIVVLFAGTVINYPVDPATVGQYTGLKDKHGKRIFEGDMLKPFDDEIDKMVVEFHHGSFLLCLYGERGYMGEGGWVEEGNYGVFECESLSSYGDDVEIIGTIHDNPELLEGGVNDGGSL